ncbi:cytochrome c-type biogenesis protein [Alterinioella nitratireducens]|uniref:cytochrome c-type biogenesis protein n=1 Tax=Alterinioella nitratireducens TaxID=2735915 RepID=UPI001554C515|nr:cytochrome c-type biogenesis protein [Alterinioella nitratireducens]NPD20945.1 cytochrome c-type biogenesis protein CcmH [Alterinioella nitratireducens]
MITRLLLVLAVVLTSATIALAVEPDEMLDDPALEARAREVSQQLRCVVCQNQDIDSSNAGIARNMRVLVRERIVAGDSNDEVLEAMVARYGNYVLLRPPFNTQTYALWLAPLVLVLLAASIGIAVIRQARRKKHEKPDELTAEEEDALRSVIDTPPTTETRQ